MVYTVDRAAGYVVYPSGQRAVITWDRGTALTLDEGGNPLSVFPGEAELGANTGIGFTIRTLEDAVKAFGNGFLDFYKGEWEEIKHIATDPVGAYIAYMTDPWNYFLAAKLMKNQITEVVGIWQDIFNGNINGLAYRLGQRTALGVQMLVIHKTGKIVNEFFVKSDGTVTCSDGAGDGVVNSVDDIAAKPQILYGKSKADVSKILGDGWTEKPYGSNQTGWEFFKGNQRIYYHPGGGIHGGSYWGYSSGITGKIKIVSPEYIPFSGEKSTIISGD